MTERCPACHEAIDNDRDTHCPACGAPLHEDDEFSWLDSCLTEPIDSSILDDHVSGRPLQGSQPSHSKPPAPDSRFSDIPTRVAEIESLQPRAISVDDALATRAPEWLKHAGLALAALLLAIALLFQLLWFNREWVVAHPAGQRLLAALCKPLGCQPPQRRDPSQLRILLSDVKPVERPAKGLLVSLTLGNAADFDQPYPRIDVTLLDTEERIVGHRVFAPRDYLLPGVDPDDRLHAHSLADASLLLADPGPRVTGYRFEFAD